MELPPFAFFVCIAISYDPAADASLQAVRRVRQMLNLPVGPPKQQLFPQCTVCSGKQVGLMHLSFCFKVKEKVSKLPV